MRPAKNVAVVTCMDARLDPGRILGFEDGDAHVIRNAGGVVTDAEIRSLAISQHLLDTEEIILMQHTDCGLLKINDEQFADRLEDFAGERPEWSAGAFDDLEESVRASMRLLEDNPFISHKNVRGYVYDLEAETLREVT